MTTARTVPVTTEMDGDELDAEDAWHLVLHHGVRAVLVEAFVRFRYGDGFTNSRALALQTALSVVPFLLALTVMRPFAGTVTRAVAPARRRRSGPMRSGTSQRCATATSSWFPGTASRAATSSSGPWRTP